MDAKTKDKPAAKKTFKFFAKNKPEMDGHNEKTDLLKAISSVRMELACTHERLNSETDETLIDGYIYEVQSLNLKYKYYLNLCKERGLAVDYVEAKYAEQS